MMRLPATILLLLNVLSAAAVAEQGGAVEFLNSGSLPEGLPFSEAVRVGNTLYLSGQIGTAAGTPGLVSGGIEAEAKQTLENIRSTLQVHGYSMGDVVKCTVMLADIAEWSTFNEVYRGFFQPPYPARSAFAANGLAMGARVELECMAAKAGTEKLN